MKTLGCLVLNGAFLLPFPDLLRNSPEKVGAILLQNLAKVGAKLLQNLAEVGVRLLQNLVLNHSLLTYCYFKSFFVIFPPPPHSVIHVKSRGGYTYNK